MYHMKWILLIGYCWHQSVFIAKLFGIKQCQCKDEHLELYEDVSEPDIPKQLLKKIKARENNTEE